jgi:LemA protein
MWLWIILLLIVVAVILIIIAYYYNTIVVLSNRIDNAFSQIDVQLKRRNDLIPNLVSTVKGYAKHEKGAIDSVTKARENMMNAGNMADKMKASNQLSNALKSILALAENYPELKANQNFLHLQQELSDTESKIAYTRQFYNDSVLTYNNTVTTFPGVIFASIFRNSCRRKKKCKGRILITTFLFFNKVII